LQEDGVDDGEDGGICADTEGEGKDADQSEAGIAGEGAEGVLEVAKEGGRLAVSLDERAGGWLGRGATM
jgi:hypothetical protein